MLIDEIDNSLSPKWQEKFTCLLVRLSKKLNDEKITHQFFISTHSPSILKNLLNSNDVAIIDVKNGKSIKEDKKLLLNGNNNVSYDEISYLYYDIITSSYYISLYEELKNKVGCESYKEMDDWLKENKDKINEIIKEKKLDKNNFVEIEKIKCIKHGKLNNDGNIKEKYLIDEDKWTVDKIRKTGNIKEKYLIDEDVDLWTISTNLTRLRHMFAHAWKKEENFLFYKKHSEQFENNNDETITKTNKFYSIFKKENITNEEIESLLKKYIELIRTILINWEK